MSVNKPRPSGRLQKVWGVAFCLSYAVSIYLVSYAIDRFGGALNTIFLLHEYPVIGGRLNDLLEINQSSALYLAVSLILLPLWFVLALVGYYRYSPILEFAEKNSNKSDRGKFLASCFGMFFLSFLTLFLMPLIGGGGNTNRVYILFIPGIALLYYPISFFALIASVISGVSAAVYWRIRDGR